jgi:hypothetical protein
VIPTDLFRYNTLVTGFKGTFSNCTNLTSIPVDVFRYNTLVTNFDFTFNQCVNLTTIPDNIFRDNINCLSFDGTFFNCRKLTLKSNIFGTSLTTRFLNQSIDFTKCFRINPFTGTIGAAPSLWTANYGTGTPTTNDCFLGHSTSSLTNYASIPPSWL